MIRFICVATTMLALIAVTADQASAQAPLFSQYNTQGAGSASAALYPAPHWSPILGGESYYPYQPLMPHEMMYQHSRNYYNYYDGGYKGGGQGLVKTSVRWQAGNNYMGPLPFSTGISGALYRVKARKYNIPGNSAGGGLGQRLRGGFGCSSGTCGAAESYIGDQYEGEVISGGCDGGCTANAGSGIQR